MTWIIIAINRTKLMAAKANKGAANGARERM